MTVELWGGGTTDRPRRADPDRRRRDRPLPAGAGLIGWYLAGDLGRAAYHLLTRGLARRSSGVLLFDIQLPGERRSAWLAFARQRRAGACWSASGSASWSPCSAFWLLDATGARRPERRVRDRSSAG